MLDMIDAYLESANSEFDITMAKVNSFLEAVDRQFEINCKEAEIKVLTESGTDDDLQFLIEAAEDGVVGSIVKALQKIKEAIIKFFSDIQAKIASMFNKDTEEKLDKLEKKAKLIPFIGKKKIAIEDQSKMDKAYNEAMSKFAQLKAKLKSGQKVSEEDIEEVSDNYKKKRALAIGVASAVTLTIAAAIVILKKATKENPKDIKDIKDNVVKVADDCVDIGEKIQDPETGRATRTLLSRVSDATKDIVNDKLRFISNTFGKIKEGLGASKKDENGATVESTDDNASADDASKVASEEQKEYEDSMKNDNSSATTESENDPIEDINPEVVDNVNDAEDPWDAVMQSLEDLDLDGDDEYADALPADECGTNCSAEGCAKESTDPELEALEAAYESLFGPETEPVEEGAKGCDHEDCIGDCIDTKGLSDSKESNEALVSDAFKALKAKIEGKEVDTTKEHDKLQESTYDQLLDMINEL